MSRNKTKHWLISDTHFGHNRLVSLGHRPEGFDKQLIENLSVVGENDIIYHTGDVSFYDHKYWHTLFMESCKARRKILILGNHDKQTVSWYYDRGWDCVCDELTIKMYGVYLILTHEPLTLFDLVGYGDNTINIHGHVHNTNHRNAQLHPNRHKAIVMEHEYKPILLQKLIGK